MPNLTRASAILTFGAALVALTALAGCHDSSSSSTSSSGPDVPVVKTRGWQILASELPAALLSVSGRSASDVFAVGADKGEGPLIFHFDGKKWAELHTGQRGDLWWVQAIPHGPVFLSGADGMVLKYDGKTFEKIPTPGAPKQTVYGVWAKSENDVYAVGNTLGHDGFIWHYQDGKVKAETLPSDLRRPNPKPDAGAASAKSADAGANSTPNTPGFYKVWGTGDDVWVVGTAGTILHKKGNGAFTRVASPTKEAIFTVSGVGDRVLVVGGSGNGVILSGDKGVFTNASPPASGLIQGVFATADHGDWASGERGFVYHSEKVGAPFTMVDHGLQLPASSSLHSIWVDETGSVWSAGGNVLTTALDNGMLIHFGDAVLPVTIDD